MDLPSITFNNSIKDTSPSTVSYRNWIWFKKCYIDRKTNPSEQLQNKNILQPGKIYCYPYDPKYKSSLDFYDEMPMMLCIGWIKTKSGDINPMGINLSFIPPKIRTRILDKIVRLFNNSHIKRNVNAINNGKQSSQRRLPLYYRVCKKILDGSGFEFAIRSYRFDRMLKKPQIITYEDWWRLITFSSKYVQKMNLASIQYRYRKELDQLYSVGQVDKDAMVKTKIKDLKEYLKTNNIR